MYVLQNTPDYWPAPGNSPAQVSLGNVTLDSTTDLMIELGGTSPGSGYDQLLISGDAELGDAPLTVDLIDGFNPALGETFDILDIAGSRTGEFAGLGEGAAFTADGQPFTLTYAGGDGNDVVLTAVPEPITFALPGLDGAGMPGRRHH